MVQSEATRTITVVTACMRPDGLPDFVLNELDVTEDEIANGAHYYLAEQKLQEDGYEEPFVHFDESEAPDFLIPALQQRFDTPRNLMAELVSVAPEGF